MKRVYSDGVRTVKRPEGGLDRVVPLPLAQDTMVELALSKARAALDEAVKADSSIVGAVVAVKENTMEELDSRPPVPPHNAVAEMSIDKLETLFGPGKFRFAEVSLVFRDRDSLLAREKTGFSSLEKIITDRGLRFTRPLAEEQVDAVTAEHEGKNTRLTLYRLEANKSK